MNSWPIYEYLVLTNDLIVLVDVGPWDRFPTITNSADRLIPNLLKAGLVDQRLFYFDSEGSLAELLYAEEGFKRFATVHPEDPMLDRIRQARKRRS